MHNAVLVNECMTFIDEGLREHFRKHKKKYMAGAAALGALGAGYAGKKMYNRYSAKPSKPASADYSTIRTTVKKPNTYGKKTDTGTRESAAQTQKVKPVSDLGRRKNTRKNYTGPRWLSGGDLKQRLLDTEAQKQQAVSSGKKSSIHDNTTTLSGMTADFLNQFNS